jgi:hypothetical protein
MIRACIAFLGLATVAAAETAKIYSGEHGTFTRLVIELPDRANWAVGRARDGYAFSLTGREQPKYDLNSVWQRIDRSRLANLGTDPDSHGLMLELACDCHIFPFEYRTGVVVLDIKPGPAPEGSVFEAMLSGTIDLAEPPLKPQGVHLQESYDWLTDQKDASETPETPVLPMMLATGDVSLEPLRDTLLQQIAQGAADGVVNMRLNGRKTSTDFTADSVLPWSHVRFGEQPGLLVGDADSFFEAVLPAADCTEAALLDFGAWGDNIAPLDLLAKARSSPYGEFDAPDLDAVLRSVRLHLYLGFGAEARQQARLTEASAYSATLRLYQSLGRIVDGEPDPDTPFATMLDCDGPAALWAALARDRLPNGPGVNRDAILRGFQALPSHLRSHLGSTLAEKFLALDDPNAARVIRDAMQRAPNADPSTIARLDAESELRRGDTQAAMDHARKAVALDGDGTEAILTLVETHFRTLEPIEPIVVEALEAMQGEASGTEQEGAIRRAIPLALALSGQTDSAFGQSSLSAGILADLWRVVEALATDDAFLRHAVLPVGTDPPDVDPDLDLAIAKRLLSLGFPDPALSWLNPVEPSDLLEVRIVAAEAELHRGNARATTDLLAGENEPEAEILREKALTRLGDFSADNAVSAAAEPAKTTIPDGTLAVDASGFAPSNPEVWSAAERSAQRITPDAETGLLSRGAAALEASVASRTAIEELLNSVATPDIN